MFFLSNPTAAMVFNDCAGGPDYYNKKYEKIRAMSRQRDVTEHIEAIRRMAADGACPDEVYNRLVTELEVHRIVGLRNHVSFMQREAQRVAAFRSPDEELSEIERARRELRALNWRDIPDDFSDNIKRVLRQRGASRSQARRRTCQNKDNRRPPLVTLDKRGNIARNNMRDQDSIGWCYAFAAADLISHEIGKNVSAIDIANAYNEGSWSDFWNSNESDMTGGFTASAANEALERGLCFESQVPSDDYVFSTDSRSLLDELTAVESLWDTYREATSRPWRNSRRRLSGPALSQAEQQFQRDLSCGQIQSDWDQLFPTLAVGDVVDILGQSSNKNSFIDNMIERSCSPRFTPPTRLTYEDDSTFTTTNTLMSRMDQKLNSGSILGISYHASTIKDRYDSSTGNHASLVVARRFNEDTGSCEYLIRNSWGNGCYSYDDELDCEQGNIWLPEEYMRQTLRGISYAH